MVKKTNKTKSKPGLKKSVLALLLIGFVGCTIWFSYLEFSGIKAVHCDEGIPKQGSTATHDYLLCKDKQLDVQFIYLSGNKEPILTKLDASDSQSGEAYFLSQPGYGGAAGITIGSTDLRYKDGDAPFVFNDPMYGDIATDLGIIKQKVIALDKKRQQSKTVKGHTMLISADNRQVAYAHFGIDNGVYLTAVKHVPSGKRLANIAFTYRADGSRVYEGDKGVSTLISDVVYEDDLKYFNTVVNSIRSYN